LRCLLIAALALGLAPAGMAAAAPPPLEAYGRLPAIEQISLSPSGEYMVSIGDLQGKRFILVRTIAGEVRLAVPADRVKVREITWVDDGHVLVNLSRTDLNFVDLGRQEYSFTVNIDVIGRKSSILFRNDVRFKAVGYGVIASYVIDAKPYAFAWNTPMESREIGGRLQGRSNSVFTRWWPDLWRIDLTTDAIDRVALGAEDIAGWAVNPDGSVAGFSNFNANSSTWALFHGNSRLMTRKSAKRQTSLMGLGRSAGSMLVLDQSGTADQWLEIEADGSTQPLWAGRNVTGPLHSPTTGLLTGAVFDEAELSFFDPVRQARIDATVKPFHGRLTIDSTTDAVDKVVLHTEGLGDSGTYYLVNLSTHRADIIDNDYPDVPPDQVGEVRRVTYTAADGQALDGVLTLPPGRPQKGLPVVVLPHGGPIGVNDRVEFYWVAQALASRGYAVFQPNYRGSSGRGAAFENAGFGEYGRAMLSDMSDGLKALAAQGVVDPTRACIVGFSYGGYAALAGVTVQQGLYRCAVSVSGPSDLSGMLKWVEERDGAGSSSDKFLKEAMGVNLVGAPGLDSISPARLASHADAPVLLIHGTDDSVVPIEQSRTMQRALQAAGKPVEVLFTTGEDHWLSRSGTRVETLKAAVAFVQKYNPAD
jgi:dienelactone hydrolase